MTQVRTSLFLITSLAFAADASAAPVVKPDSLLCESDAALEHVLSNPRMASLPGSEAIAKSKAQVELLQQGPQADSTAATVRRINPDLQRRTEVAESRALAGAKSVIAKCASSGANPMSVTVLERWPISGIAYVSATFRGSPAKLYVPLAAITDE